MLLICENTDIEQFAIRFRSLKSVQQFENVLWFTAASTVDDESFAVSLLFLFLKIIPSAGSASQTIFSNKQEQMIWSFIVDYAVSRHAMNYWHIPMCFDILKNTWVGTCCNIVICILWICVHPGAHLGGLIGCHARPLCTAGTQH